MSLEGGGLQNTFYCVVLALYGSVAKSVGIAWDFNIFCSCPFSLCELYPLLLEGHTPGAFFDDPSVPLTF